MTPSGETLTATADEKLMALRLVIASRGLGAGGPGRLLRMVEWITGPAPDDVPEASTGKPVEVFLAAIRATEGEQ